MEFDENLNPIEPPLEPDWKQTPPPAGPSFNYQPPTPEPPLAASPGPRPVETGRRDSEQAKPQVPPSGPVATPGWKPPMPPQPLMSSQPLSEPDGPHSRRPAANNGTWAKRLMDLITIA